MISPVKGKKGGRSAFMRILILGDVVGEAGVRYVSSRLWSVRKSEKIDFAVVRPVPLRRLKATVWISAAWPICCLCPVPMC